MIFEVDNTTEELIKELQAGIANTILGLSEGQEKLEGKIDKVRQEFGELAKTEQIEDASEDIQKVIKKMGIPYSQQQGEELSLLLKNVMNQVEVSVDGMQRIEKRLEGVYTKQQGEEVLSLLSLVSQKVEQLTQLENENQSILIQIESYLKKPLIKRLFRGKGEVADET